MNRWMRLALSLMTAWVLTAVIRTNNEVGECAATGATCVWASWLLTAVLFAGFTIASLRFLRNIYRAQKGGNH